MGNSTSGPGVQGTSSTFTGLLGVSNSGAGVQGASSTFIGVSGSSNTFDAVQGVIGSGRASSFHAGVAGLDRSTSGATNEGVFGDTTLGMAVWGESYGTGTGVQGSSPSGVGVNAIGGFVGSGQPQVPALSIVGDETNGYEPDLILACPYDTANPCDNLHAVFGVGSEGNLSASTIYATSTLSAFTGTFASFVQITSPTGEYLIAGNCVLGCSSSATSERRVRTYAPRSSQPMIEDNGEAQLVNGSAYIRVDPAFANVIDQRTVYSVSITPEGDSNGLFVTQKTLNGFVVHENHGGRSTLAFEYRIVAKPYGSTAKRLPMVDIPLRPRHTITRAWRSGAVVPVR